MPIYEYRRPDGSTFEMVQSFSDDPLTQDPETGDPVERVLHAPAVHFKGKGFYNTDYGTRKRQREDSSAKAESKIESESKNESKKEDSAKPAEKADAKPAHKPAATAAKESAG
jgi:putative FmdB family regulatory protein